MSDLPGVVLTILTADCVPILFYDPVRRAIAGDFIAGAWRGEWPKTKDSGCPKNEIRNRMAKASLNGWESGLVFLKRAIRAGQSGGLVAIEGWPTKVGQRPFWSKNSPGAGPG